MAQTIAVFVMLTGIDKGASKNQSSINNKPPTELINRRLQIFYIKIKYEELQLKQVPQH